MPSPRDPAPHADTRWSLVAAARGGGARAPVAELCARYWYPAYAWLRHGGLAPGPAQQATGVFLRRLVAERLQHLDARQDLRFRDFVLAELRDAPCATDGEPGAGTIAGLDAPLPAGEMEARYAVDCADCADAEAAYTRALGQALTTRALESLRAEARGAGREALFARIEPFLAAEPTTAQHAAICSALGVGALVVALGLRSARQRLRQLVDDELAQAAGSDADLAQERRTLRIGLPEASPR